MSRRLSSSHIVLAIALLSSAACKAQTDRTLYELNLQDAKALSLLREQGADGVQRGPDNSACLLVHSVRRPSGDAGVMISIPIDLSTVRGAQLAVTGRAEATDVEGAYPGTPKDKWAGVKFQIAAQSAKGRAWRDTSPMPKTFAWRDLGMIFGVPADATHGELRLGLENATGDVCYTGLRVTVSRPRLNRVVAPDAAARLTKKTTEYRGVMSPQSFHAEDFKDLRKWNVNLVRWQMNTSKKRVEGNDEWIEPLLDQLAQALAAAKENGIKLVIDLHSPPGGRESDATLRFVLQQRYQDQFIDVWQRIARRFKGNPSIYGYDLINEPVQNRPSPAGMKDWLATQVLVANAVRKIDPDTPIIIETDGWDSPESYEWLKPIDLPNVIYQVHMYKPGAFTNQGVSTDQGITKDMDLRGRTAHYPGTIDGVMTDRETLRSYLQPVRNFQLAYNARIYCGEFSSARWAPGADKWLEDVTSIFEEWGWDYTYHAFREWQGWSLEDADLPYDHEHGTKSTTPTDRLQVMLKRYALNKRPK